VLCAVYCCGDMLLCGDGLFVRLSVCLFVCVVVFVLCDFM